jgi:hypothetical protein
LDSIKTYNYLAASLPEYNNEVKAQKVSVQAEKKKVNAEKAANKVRRDQQAEEQQQLLLPICKEHAARCLAHCLSLSLIVTMKEVLKYVFNISETNMRKTQAIELIANTLSST